MLKYINLAARMAAPRNIIADWRTFWMAAVGVRHDGAIVSSRNGSVIVNVSYPEGYSFPQSHAEARLIRKMDHHGTVYVARISREDGRLMMARPCFDCMNAMRSRSVKKVYYSVSDNEYGVIDLRGEERRVTRDKG